MKQYPSRLKYKKYHKPNYSFSSLIERKSFVPLFGTSGLQAMEAGKITFKQIEACRRSLRRALKKTGNIWIRIFTSIPVTKKPVAVRMGKGKGAISYWVAPVKKGQILFEISELDNTKIDNVLNKALVKLPIKVKIVTVKY